MSDQAEKCLWHDGSESPTQWAWGFGKIKAMSVLVVREGGVSFVAHCTPHYADSEFYTVPTFVAPDGCVTEWPATWRWAWTFRLERCS